MNVEALSRAELLTLLSVLEGELEAQDVVIHALRVSCTLHLIPMDSHCKTLLMYLAAGLSKSAKK